jgi:DNA-binding NarL/FixJ family response regulator
MKNAGDTAKKAEVLIVDDHPLLREGVVQFLNRQEDIAVCAEADSIASAQSALRRRRPDLVLLDLRLGASDTVDFIKTIKAEHGPLPVLVFSQFDETLFAEKALRAGANGYVMKQEATEEVLLAIRTVLRGQMYVSRQLAVLIFQKSMGAPTQPPPEEEGDVLGVNKLTDRELHVFQLIGTGFGARRIAEELSLSVKTVESHRENIKRKLGLATAVELNRCATDWVGKHLLPEGNGSVSVVWKPIPSRG